MCDDTQYLHSLSSTESGRQHDKKIADEYPLHLPAGSVLQQDLGLLGHSPSGVLVEMPHKKLSKRELFFSQKRYNQLLSPLRVVIEHAHSGLKCLRMVKDIVCIRSEWFRDTVMVVACTTCASSARTGTTLPASVRNSQANAHKHYYLKSINYNYHLTALTLKVAEQLTA